MYGNMKDRIDGFLLDVVLAVLTVAALVLFGKWILWLGHKVAGQ